jgi:Spy/CpxP family protein refolding chaperone
MADSKVIITDDVKANHPELVQMIMGTESMNDEERQYWMDLLPIMNAEQIENLHDILDNERKKLAEIDSYYSQKVEDIEKAEEADRIQAARKAKMNDLEEAEIANEVSEKEREAKLMAELENL